MEDPVKILMYEDYAMTVFSTTSPTKCLLVLKKSNFLHRFENFLDILKH